MRRVLSYYVRTIKVAFGYLLVALINFIVASAVVLIANAIQSVARLN